MKSWKCGVGAVVALMSIIGGVGAILYGISVGFIYLVPTNAPPPLVAGFLGAALLFVCFVVLAALYELWKGLYISCMNWWGND